MKSVLVSVSISVVNMLSSSISKESELSEALEVSILEKKYDLTQPELTSLREAGLAWPSYARVVHFARIADKTVKEILKMRFEDKKSWGSIAHEIESLSKSFDKALVVENLKYYN